MAFDGSEGEQITVTEGAALTAAYNATHPSQRKAHFFGKDILLELLAQQDCMGIRIYQGINEEGQRELVLVGADVNENDMTNLVADRGVPCPSYCSPKKNPLNS